MYCIMICPYCSLSSLIIIIHHYSSLFIIIHHLSSFIIIHHVSSFIIIHHYSSLFIIIHHVSSFIILHHYSSCIIIHHCSSLFIIYHHSSLFIMYPFFMVLWDFGLEVGHRNPPRFLQVVSDPGSQQFSRNFEPGRGEVKNPTETTKNQWSGL